MCTPQPGYVIDSNGRSVSDQNPGARLEGSSMLPGFEKQASGELALPETIMATNIQGLWNPHSELDLLGKLMGYHVAQHTSRTHGFTHR